MQNTTSNTSVATKFVMAASRHNAIALGKACCLADSGWLLVGSSEGWAIIAHPDKKSYQLRVRLVELDVDSVVSQVESRVYTKGEWAAWTAKPQHSNDGLFAQEVAEGVWYVLGDTYRHRIALKKAGGSFNPSNGGWKFSNANLPTSLLPQGKSKWHMLAIVLSRGDVEWIGYDDSFIDRWTFGYDLQRHADKRLAEMPQDPDRAVVVCDRCEVAEVGHVCPVACGDCNQVHGLDDACPELCGRCAEPLPVGCNCPEEFAAEMLALAIEEAQMNTTLCEICEEAEAVHGCFCVPCGDRAQYNDLDANGQY